MNDDILRRVEKAKGEKVMQDYRVFLYNCLQFII